jgi:hypothetical protein
MKEKLIVGMCVMCGILFICVMTYGINYVRKTISYDMFYKSQVEETIREMVKPEYLINNE